MRKYDYEKMIKAISHTEPNETRELLVLLEMDWSHAQVLQFLRERDSWRKTTVVSVKPVNPTTKEDEPLVHTVNEVAEAVNDQITDSVTTKITPKKKP